MPRLYTRKAKKDHHGIKAGKTYFMWHPKGSPWQYSTERPDLRSAWDIEISDFQERVDQRGDPDEDESLSEDLSTRRDELQTNLDAMPEQLQESSILNERIEQLDDLINELN